jgi:hypothetical protein
LLSNSAIAKPLISVVLSESGGAYSVFPAALQANLSNNDLKIRVQNTAQPIPNSSLVIVVGMKAASYALQSNERFVLNVMISKSVQQQLTSEFSGKKTYHNSLRYIWIKRLSGNSA